MPLVELWELQFVKQQEWLIDILFSAGFDTVHHSNGFSRGGRGGRGGFRRGDGYNRRGGPPGERGNRRGRGGYGGPPRGGRGGFGQQVCVALSFSLPSRRKKECYIHKIKPSTFEMCVVKKISSEVSFKTLE